MPSPKGAVSAMLLAAAGVAFAPAFIEASNELNFSVIQYGTELELVMGFLPLVVVLVGFLMLGITMVR